MVSASKRPGKRSEVAVANGCYVVAVNRTGHEVLPGSDTGAPGIEFWGSSFVADPSGRGSIARADQDEEVLTIDCDLAAVDIVRTHWPFLRDHRIDAYSGLTQRYLD